MPRERFSPSPDRQPQAPLEKKANDAASLDDTRLFPRGPMRINSKKERVQGFKAVKAEDAWLETYEPTDEAPVEPIDFSKEELEEVNNELPEFTSVREQIEETGRAVAETACGIRGRLFPEKRPSRVSSLESLRKLLMGDAKESPGILRSALNFAAERLGIVKAEQRELAERAENVEANYQENLADLYDGEVPESSVPELNDLLDAYQELNAIPEAELEGAK